MAVTTTGIYTCDRSTGSQNPASAQTQRPPTNTIMHRVLG